MQPIGHRPVPGRAVDVVVEREQLGGDVRGLRSLQCLGARLVGGDGDDLDAVPAVGPIEQRLEVGARAGGEDRDPHAAGRAEVPRRSFGKRPPVERSLPAPSS